jgi:hypothetical protein
MEDITRLVDGVHDLLELYGDETLNNDKKQIDMLERIYFELKNIGVNKGSIIPEIVQVPNKYNLSKLEKFELEEQIKQKELDIQIKKELVKKQQKDELLKLKLQKQQEEEALLHRMLKIFSSRNTAVFNCGYISEFHNGINCIDTTYSFTCIGSKQYVLTIELLKHIKSENKEVLKQKYDRLIENYMWIKKFVMNEGLIAFVFEDFTIDSMIERELFKIEELKIQEDTYTQNHLGRFARSILVRQQKIEKLTRIKAKSSLKTKEYYIANHDEFFKDFEMNDMKLNISLNDENWTILDYWVKEKQLKFNELIKNINEIKNPEGYGNTNFICREYYNGGCLNTITGTVFQLYPNYVMSKTHRSRVTEPSQGKYDIVNDYIPEYFEPLLSLSKIIIDMIYFIQNE